jgi:transaldolase
MKATQKLHDMGQSLWLDNITRGLLTSGTLRNYIKELLGHGPHLEPHDLRSRHQEQSRLRRRHPPEIEGRQVGRGAVLRAGD